MHNKEILSIDDLSIIIGRSPRAIRIAQSRGQEGETIPPSVKMGGRRYWIRKVVESWLDELARSSVGDK